MKNFKQSILFFGIILITTISCVKDVTEISETEENTSELEINNLNIPSGFDFSTQQEVKITINDAKNYVKYSVYAYSDEKYFQGMETYQNEEGVTVTDSIFKSDVLNKLLFTGVAYNGKLSHTISLPAYYNQVYILRNDNLKYSSSIQTISNKQVNFSYAARASKSSATIVDDYLYCVNGSAELFQVNPLSGEYTYISDMPMGSYTCAIDQANKLLYSIGKSSPYPLMKYDIEANTWETVGNVKQGGPRLEYNYRDGLLYFSNNSIIYTYDPSNGNTLGTWDIIGLHKQNGGDLAFAEDGTLFLCSFSGLYKLKLDSNNDYIATRISADNLPFSPTSMTFDSNQELWLSNSSNSSDLIIMDTQTGGWEYKYGVSANNNTSFGRTINDLTTFRIYTETEENIDSDGDGIIDIDDEYPDDAEKAFEIFTPSKYGWGTIAFEDLWPSTGDYDFNDLALNYKVIAVLNSQNMAVQLDFIYNVKANGASYTNAFGIEIENLKSSQIQSVTGLNLTQGYINLNTNGTETGQDNAVVIFFDNSHTVLDKETTVSIKFTEPISTSTLGTAPFNPFMIINKIREKEVHLPNGHTTTLGEKSFEIDGINRDKDGDYLTDNGLPWAINIVHDFKVPKEKVSITNAYNYFSIWATSGGTNYEDWYKDNPGYRNDDKIDN
ncbi:LruC domain-containing protein [Lutibacter sp.]|uniref:LruC domain-containing protein n=1 Tax=Lutibacter sp. TaxID=1925666 RepID=UPI003563999A